MIIAVRCSSCGRCMAQIAPDPSGIGGRFECPECAIRISVWIDESKTTVIAGEKITKRDFLQMIDGKAYRLNKEGASMTKRENELYHRGLAAELLAEINTEYFRFRDTFDDFEELKKTEEYQKSDHKKRQDALRESYYYALQIYKDLEKERLTKEEQA